MSYFVLMDKLRQLEYLDNALIIQTKLGIFYVDRTEYNHFHCIGKDVNFYFYTIPDLLKKAVKIIFMDFVKIKKNSYL
jgi:hypothetical protein